MLLRYGPAAALLAVGVLALWGLAGLVVALVAWGTSHALGGGVDLGHCLTVVFLGEAAGGLV